MSDQSPLNTTSAKVKKALIWVSETLQDHPQKHRLTVLHEAQVRFDLTPVECDFLNRHFSND